MNPYQQLQKLPVKELEQAMEFLADPELTYPPQNLQHLNLLEWHLVNSLLNKLMKEKQYSRVQ